VVCAEAVRETINATATHREREANGKNLATNAHNWRWEMAELQNNLMVLEYTRRFTLLEADPTHLSPQQLARTIELTEIAIEKHIQVGKSVAYISSQFPDLPASLTYDEIGKYLHSSYEDDPQAMAAAHQLTMDRLRAAGYVPQDDALPSPGSK
jgi:hypothetical protein